MLQKTFHPYLFCIDEAAGVGYVLVMPQQKQFRRVPRPVNAVPDEIAAQQLGISRMTMFRKLRDGSLTAPASISGTKRRWWRPADIAVAREQLMEAGL